MSSSSNDAPTREKFDCNQAALSGAVRRMWSSGADILVRLAVPVESAGPQAPADPDGLRVTLLLPGGAVAGQPVTLLKGDRLQVQGYLVDAPYTETGRQFAERTRREDLLTAVPGLAAAVAERMATYIVVEGLAYETAPTALNTVTVEGIVSRVWDKGSQRFARLAIYDRHTRSGDQVDRHGRPWRQAHYVSVHFPEGQVAGRSVRLQKKDRIRVSGRLSEHRYSESLAYFLMRAGQIGLLAEVANADDVREIRTPRVAAYVVAESLIQFTK